MKPGRHCGGARRRAALLLVMAIGAVGASAQPVLITSPATINPSDGFITPTAGGPAVPLATADITVRGTTLTVNGRHTIRNLFVESNGTVTHAASFTHDYSGGAGTDVVNGMWLNVQANPSGGNVSIDATSRIDVTGKGYGSQQGPGYSSDTGLASHGGRSIYNPCCHTPAPTYGSVRQPTELGSGAGTRGGGAVRLIVNGTLTLDGEIHADGVYDQYASSGSGGSVWITAGTITGEGAVSADSWWWSGGGRVSVESTSNEFTGEIQALGGANTPTNASGAGTVWISENGIGTLIIDNKGRVVSSNLPLTTTPITASSIVLSASDAVVVAAGAVMEVVDPILVGSLDVIDGGVVTHRPGHLLGARVTVDGDALIDATSRIDVTGKGYGSQQGPGYSSDTGLASHGGRSIYNPCCHTPAPTYGSVRQPTELGSGAGTRGGGAVRLIVNGTLTLDGEIHADGVYDQYASSGSGGSVWITAGTITGEGAVSADSWWWSGGGRVSVESTSNEFTGDIRALGGLASRTSTGSGAGTVWISEDGIGTLIIDNRGLAVPANAPLTTTPITDDSVTFSDADSLIVRDMGIAELRDPISLWSVVVGDGGRIVSESGSSASIDITTVSDLIVEVEGMIDVAGRGYGPGSGPGYPWQDDTYNCTVFGNCCGSAHTLMGSCPVGHQSGASIYGSAMAPTTPGSGSWSGPGGGSVQLTVGGGLYVDGLIRADGVAGGGGIHGGNRADGGSGGSIWITASELAGTGYVSTLGIGRSVGGPLAVYACSMTLPFHQLSAGALHLDTDGMLVISEPASASFCAGPDYAFTFGVLGATSFQWTRDGVPLVDGPTGTGSVISGSETSTLTIVNATTADAGVYRATASSACGNIESQDATLGNCPAEYNCDDGVDILDFLDFIDDFAACELQPGPCGSLGNADTNGDTFVDILDFLDFLDSFGSGC